MSNVIINDWDSIETLKVKYLQCVINEISVQEKMNVIQKLILL